MAKLLEIDFDSKYVLISKKPLTPEKRQDIRETWRVFLESKEVVLLMLDGTEFELVQRRIERKSRRCKHRPNIGLGND